MTAIRSAIRFFRSNYVVFESVQASLVMGTGDYIAQKHLEKKEKIDLKRMATFAGLGLLFTGPIASTWYHFLEGRVPYCWSKWKRGLTKMALDQILVAPIMLACVISILEFIEGDRSAKGVKNELKKKYSTILLNNYKVWPAVQLFNFALVPVHLQVLVSQAFGVGWNTYLSSAKRSDGTESPTGKKASKKSRDSKKSTGSKKSTESIEKKNSEDKRESRSEE